MRLIFAAMAAHGHTYPLVPLAQAAVRAGHDVVFAADAQFVPKLQAAGLTAVEAGMSIPDAIAKAPSVGHGLGEVMAQRWADDLTPLTRDADLIIHDITTLGAALAGATNGVPALAHTFGRVDPGPMWRSINDIFERNTGLKPGRVLDICPESLQAKPFVDTADRIPLRPDGWSPPGAPVRQRRPLIYLTLGTAFATRDVLRQCVGELAKLPVNILVTTGPAVSGTLGEVPGNVQVEEWVAQQDVLPKADLVVHHGGSGTMLGALKAGLPQLILPQGADGLPNAEAVETAGAGIRMYTTENIAEHAEALLKNPPEGARRLAGEIAAMPSPDQVISDLA